MLARTKGSCSPQQIRTDRRGQHKGEGHDEASLSESHQADTEHLASKQLDGLHRGKEDFYYFGENANQLVRGRDYESRLDLSARNDVLWVD